MNKQRVIAGSIFVVLLLVVGTVYFATSNNEPEDKGTKTDDTKSESANDILSFVVESDLPAGYYISNEPTDLDEILIKDEAVSKLNISAYCDGNDGDLLCETMDKVYIHSIKNQNDDTVWIRVSTEFATSSEAGSNFLAQYKDRLQKSKDNLRCNGGLLHNEDKTQFVYVIVDAGKADSGVYEILENIKERRGLVQFFRCDQLPQL